MMIRRFGPWILPLVLIVLCTVRAMAADPPADTETSGERVPVLGYFLAFGFTVLTMVILCMPSRKA
jgi:hypothetical protein